MAGLFPKQLFGRVNQKPTALNQVIAVSSPYGSTGKTTVAINLALELASGSAKVLLIDADFEGASVANQLLLTELPAGLPGALRVASQNRFDLEQLERLSIAHQKSTLRILPSHPGRISNAASVESMTAILDTARSVFDFTVVDLGSISSSESQLASDSYVEAVFQLSEKQIVVCLADPIGIYRLLGQESTILELANSPVVVMNRVRNSVISQAKKEIAITMQRLSQLEVACYLPDDPQQIDHAVRTGVQAVALSRSGSFRHALTGFTRSEILGTRGPLDSRLAKLG
ncbi:unannotated protein [freshwater metagenome]|uniref:Unannotated protein n=1 Tax=freshwater metagenome TaxID=449393 RepID=A0A6J6J0K7_9ZZZZ|nr:AAA family ATPase [Actinomycetota bacterium]